MIFLFYPWYDEIKDLTKFGTTFKENYDKMSTTILKNMEKYFSVKHDIDMMKDIEDLHEALSDPESSDEGVADEKNEANSLFYASFDPGSSAVCTN